MDSATFDQVCEVNHLNSRDLLVVSDFREGFALADTRDMLTGFCAALVQPS